MPLESSSKKTVIVGKIASPYGVKGWLKIISFTDPPENILNYQPWFLWKNQKSQEMVVINSQKQVDRFTVHFQGINDPETARLYSNAEIYVDREQLPSLPPDEYYWTDLEGLEVINNQNESLGKVDHVLATGSNDVLVIQGEKRHLIPFLPKDVILKVDLEAKVILVDWDAEF